MNNLTKQSPVKREIRACISSYIALAGIWILMTIACTHISIKSHGQNWEIASAICATCSILWILWLRGFKLTVTDEFLEYRDGFYRISKIHLSNYSEMKHKWVKWKNLGRTLTIPRIAVSTKDRKTAFLINDKPFKLDDIHMIRDILKIGSDTISRIEK